MRVSKQPIDNRFTTFDFLARTLVNSAAPVFAWFSKGWAFVLPTAGGLDFETQRAINSNNTTKRGLPGIWWG
jgi:hypothetical protein